MFIGVLLIYLICIFLSFMSIVHLFSIKPKLTYSGLPSEFLNLSNRNYEYRNEVWLKVSDFWDGLFLIPKSLLFFYELVPVVSFFLFYALFFLFFAIIVGSFVTHEPIRIFFINCFAFFIILYTLHTNLKFIF
jgi:hypothetical protein